MPFNISPSSYQGGSFLFQGLSGAGQGIGEAIQKAQEQSKLESYNDSIVQHAYQSGQLDLEQLTKYRQMGHTQKTGYAASLAANFAEDMKRQQLAAMQEQRQAQAELRQQQAAAFSWTPDEAARQAARLTGNELVPTGPGKYTLAPYGGSDQDWKPSGSAMFVTDPSGNVVGRQIQTGPNQSQFLPGTGGLTVKQDPKTKSLFYLEGSKWKPLKGQDIMAGQMVPEEATPSPTPAPSGGGMTVGDILNAIGSIGATSPADIPGGAAQSPAPAAAAVASAPVATATGNDVTDKRQQAIAILTQAGKPVTEANIGAVIKKLEK
jgi:hypothetical protein